MPTNLPRLRALGAIALVAGCALAVPVGTLLGVTLTGDRLAGCAALLVAAGLLLRGRVRWTAVHAALGLFVAIQVTTSLAQARSWPQGLKFVGIYALGFGCFVVAAELGRDAAGRRAAAEAWRLAGGALGAIGALLALVASARQTEVWGTGTAQMLTLGPEQSLVVFAARVTFPEWNLLSSFLLVAFALGLWRWSSGAPGFPVALAGTAAGLVFGVTRAAWIATAGIAVAWAVSQRPSPRRMAELALMIAIPVAAQALALGASPIVTRVVEPLRAGEDPNLAGRRIINRAVARSWSQAPLLGRGAGSSNRLSVRLPDGSVAPRLWTGNMELFVLHDSGVAGLAALLLVVGAAALAVRRAARQGAAAWRALGWPLAVSAVALVWAWQFTHALWLMYPYAFLGLLVACTAPGVEA